MSVRLAVVLVLLYENENVITHYHKTVVKTVLETTHKHKHVPNQSVQVEQDNAFDLWKSRAILSTPGLPENHKYFVTYSDPSRLEHWCRSSHAKVMLILLNHDNFFT